MPIISIIVPVYKVEGYLKKCLVSILNQTFNDFELILVDDGSPDSSGEICDDYAKKDNRVKVIHKQNGGLSDARNAGLNIAIGDFVGFVDSDDYIEADMYEKLLDACKNNNSDISMCGRYDVYADKIIPSFNLHEAGVWDSKDAIANLLTWNNIDSSACDKLFNKKLFENIRFPVNKYNEDIFIMTQILYNAKKIVHIGESKYYYFHRSDSITTESFSERKLDLLDASQKVVDFISEKYPSLLEKAFSFYYTGLIFLYYLILRSDEKDEYKKQFIILKDLFYKSYFSIMSNPYVSKENKKLAILLYFKIYSIVRYLKNKYFRMRRHVINSKYT